MSTTRDKRFPPTCWCRKSTERRRGAAGATQPCIPGDTSIPLIRGPIHHQVVCIDRSDSAREVPARVCRIRRLGELIRRGQESKSILLRYLAIVGLFAIDAAHGNVIALRYV